MKIVVAIDGQKYIVESLAGEIIVLDCLLRSFNKYKKGEEGCNLWKKRSYTTGSEA